MQIRQLETRRREVRDEARAILDEMKDDASKSELKRLEKKHSELVGQYDSLSDEIEDLRANEASHEARIAKRPGVVAGETGGGDEPVEERVAGLRPEQRMFDWARREHEVAAEDYRGMSAGSFLRATMLGGKNGLERRALAEGTDSAGGYTVPTIVASQMIDLARAASVVNRAGAMTIPLESDATVVAKVLTDPAPAWRSENGSVAESDPTFAAVNFTARSLAVMVKVSRELMQDSVNLQAELPRILAVAMAAELDRAALLGSGTAPEPQGVANMASIETTALSAALTNYSPLLTARKAVMANNFTPSAYVMHTRDENTLAGFTASDNQPLQAPRQVSDIPFFVTNKIATDGGAGSDESSIFCGDFRRLMIGVRSELRIEIIREAYAASHQVALIAHLRADVAATHENAFHVTTAVQG